MLIGWLECRSEWSDGVDRVAGVWLECRSEWSVGVDRVAGGLR